MTLTMVEKNNPDLIFSDHIFYEDNVVLPSKENIIVYDLGFKKLFSLHDEEEISRETLQNILEKGESKFPLGPFGAIGMKYKTNSGKELIVIAKGKFISEELIRLRNIMIFTFFLYLIMVAITGYYFAGQALRPIINTMNELDDILPYHLTKRLHTIKSKDEISRLIISFNHLLDRIEEAFNVQKGFLSNVSHELRNPLASIIATIQVTISKERNPSEYIHCLETVLHVSSDLEHTSSHLMQLARLSGGSDEIFFGPVRIDEVIWQAKAHVKKTNIGYNFKFDASELPMDSELFEINANESLLKTAFINLLENACKFSPDHIGFIKLYITPSNEVAVEIRDTAQIIEANEIENIFKPFYRSPITQKIKGSGIGLSLVASILNIHNARLKITESALGGNKFTVYFSPVHSKSN